MPSLREHLTEALTGHSGVLDTASVADDALEVFAAWLRERAGQVRDRNRSGPTQAVTTWADDRARVLEAVADEIWPLCLEAWGDEVGCGAGVGDHRCAKPPAGHRWHRCRCGALMLEDPKERSHPNCWTGGHYEHTGCVELSGRACIDCGKPAGTLWGPLCPDCDVKRLDRISAQLAALRQELEAPDA